MTENQLKTKPQPKNINDTFDFSHGENIIDFVHDFATSLSWDSFPDQVQQRTRLLCLDLVGVMACGTDTPVSRIIRDYASNQHGPGATCAHLPFDGRPVSPAGAALAIGMTIDSIDAHDGHRLVKGHVGCGIFASLLAYADDLKITDGRELLTALTIGYEIGTRAGRALHEAPETDAQYHSSGAWVALACAVMGARLMGFDAKTMRHALAIAEYHGPRSLVLKVANYPSMLKDGSGWGAMAGVSAAYLARAGFDGAPVISLESAHLQKYWLDLGKNWETLNQYVKPQPVCRWTQQATEAAAGLMARHKFNSQQIVKVVVETFREATLLSQELPSTTEEAQYNVRFPLAVLLSRSKLGAHEVTDPAVFKDREIIRLHKLVEMRQNDEFDALFPAERWAIVRIELDDGTVLESPPTVAPGDPETMLSRDQFINKFHDLAASRLDNQSREKVVNFVDRLEVESDGWQKLRAMLG